MNEKKVKKFDAVEMSLSIKRKLYEENKNLSIADYLKKLSEEAKKSKFWKTKSPTSSSKKTKRNSINRINKSYTH